MSKKVYVKPYPKEFREQVVKLVQLGDRSALEVAREFEISVDSVRRWMQQAERCWTFFTCTPTVLGSAVLPANTSTATGQPSAAQSRPKTICCLPCLPSRLWPNAASGKQRPSR